MDKVEERYEALRSSRREMLVKYFFYYFFPLNSNIIIGLRVMERERKSKEWNHQYLN